MIGLLKIPTRFIEDRIERGLPVPLPLGETSSGDLIDPADPALPGLVSDAEHYAGRNTDAAWLVQPARALLRAIYRARPDLRPGDSCIPINQVKENQQ